MRITVFLLLCGSAVFLSSKGLGQQPQTFTAFSEEKKHDDVKAGFQEVKGLKVAAATRQLNNPFVRNQNKGGDPAGALYDAGHNGTAQSGRGSGRPEEKGKTPDGRETKPKHKPVLRGILTGNGQRAAVMEYGEGQYILHAGDRFQDMRVESVSESAVIINTTQGSMVLDLNGTEIKGDKAGQ